MTSLNYIFGKPDSAGCVLSIGSFDGVHLGHLSVIDQVRELASEMGLQSVVASFDPHPREVLLGKRSPLLSPGVEKATHLRNAEVDAFALVPFTKMLSFLEPEDFIESILVNRLGVKAVVVGYDHRFGRNRRGDVQLLKQLGERFDYSVHQCQATEMLEAPVSSSRIRELIKAGNVKGAKELLGRQYDLAGNVVQGARRGRTLGVPTANLVPDHERKLIPGIGVYAVQVYVSHLQRSFGGMMNIGTRPTFDGKSGIHIEVNLFDFDGDLYERELRVEFVERIRNEKKFGSIEEIKRQLIADKERCRRSLSEIS